MYYYIFEPAQKPAEFETITSIKNYLSQLGIAGEMVSPSAQKPISALVEQAIQKRYSTIISVGGTAFTNQVVRTIQGHDVVCGILPLDSHPDITNLIGTSNWKEAAENLKARRWRSVQLGMINQSHYFLTPATLNFPPANQGDNFQIHTNSYQLTGLAREITISPLEQASQASFSVTCSGTEEKRSFLSNLFGGSTSSQLKNTTQIYPRDFHLSTTSPISVSVAGAEITQTPIECTLSPLPFRLIVAKGMPD